MEKRTLQVSGAVLVCALVFRLLGGGVMETTLEFLRRPEVIKTVLFLETGRLVRSPPESTAEPPVQETECTLEIPETTVEDVKVPVFSPSDVSFVSVHNTSGYEANAAEALLTPLLWELTGDEPAVLILHTHGSESYVNTEGYKESSAFRTLDAQYNIVSVGDRLAKALEEKGISVLHDRTLHDYPSYNGAYNHAREEIARYLEQYPSIQLVLDLHRDAITDDKGNQVGYSITTSEGSAAKMLLVLGTGSGGLHHPNWQENFRLGVKLHAQLEKNQPGICRDLSLRSTRFNQDMMPGMVLVEMGAAGNTRQEALLSADILAQAIADLAHGTG